MLFKKSISHYEISNGSIISQVHFVSLIKYVVFQLESRTYWFHIEILCLFVAWAQLKETS